MTFGIPSTRNQPAAIEVSPVPLGILGNVYWASAGSILYAASQWAIIATLANLTTPNVLGVFSLGLAVTGPVHVFFNMQLRTFQATDAKGEFATTTYFLTRLFTTIAAWIIVVGICIWNAFPVAFCLIVAVLTFAKSIEGFSDICYGRFQLAQRLDLVAVSQIIKAILALASFALTLYFTGALLASLTAMAASWLVTLLALDLRTMVMFKDAKPKACSEKGAWNLIWRGLPAAPAALFVALETNVPRYYLASTQDLNELGLYSALAHVSIAIQFIAVSIFHALVPRLAALRVKGNHHGSRRMVLKACALGAGTGAVAVVTAVFAGNSFLSLVYGSEYAGHTRPFALLIAATAISFVWLPLAADIQAKQQLWARFWLHLVSLIAIAMASALLVPGGGIHGAACAIFIGSVVQLVGYLWVSTVSDESRPVDLKRSTAT